MQIALLAVDDEGRDLVIAPFDTPDAAREWANQHLAFTATPTLTAVVSPDEYLAD